MMHARYGRTRPNPTASVIFYSCLCLDLSQAKLAADRERQMLLRDYEALQRAYRELKAEKSALLEEQVQFRNIMIWEFLLLKYFCGCMAHTTEYF